mmetsp:Transcript_51144/g.79953  ORF Transcript_51144/g.79953 Transcript_51144/m.79953 type:complete len:817 (+) Transcript_51144:58-2508(+)
MGSISTAQCSDVTLAKFLAPSSPPIEQVAPFRRSRAGTEANAAASPHSPRSRKRSTSHPSASSSPFNDVNRAAQPEVETACSEPSRDEAVAHIASAKIASRDSLEALWVQISSSMDAYFARLVGRGHSLEEQDVVAASHALLARDCASLLRYVQRLWEQESGNAPEVHAEASRIRDAEERHVVLCQLEDAIRRADVDDMELWLEEALQLGLQVELEQRYCKSMRAALQDLCEGADAVAEDVGGQFGFAWDTGGTTVSSPDGVDMDAFATAGAEFDTWNSAFSDPLFFPDAAEIMGGCESPPARSNDDANAAERNLLWAQLEEALKSKDLHSAFEAIAMLESIGELDAETAAEARALAEEEQRSQLPRQPSVSSPVRRRHSAPGLHQPWDVPPTSFGTSSASTAPAPRPDDRRFAEQGVKQASRSRVGTSFGRERSGAGWAAHMAAVHANVSATRRETENWSTWQASGPPKASTTYKKDESRQDAKAPEVPKMSHAPKMRQTPSDIPKAPIKAAAPTPATASVPTTSQPAPSIGIRGRLFKEALWKRKINMQTMNRMRSGSQPVSAPESPRTSREHGRTAYAASVRNAVRAERPSDCNTSSGFAREPATNHATHSDSQWKQSYPKMRAGAVGEDAPERHPSRNPPEAVPSKASWSFFNRETRQTSASKEAASSKQQPPKPMQAKPQPAPPPPPPQMRSKAPPKQPPHKAAQASPTASPAPKTATSGSSKSAPEAKPKAAPPPSRPSPGPMELLDLKPGFNDDDLRAAYKRAAMRWHPDRPAWRAAGEAEVQHATEMFQKCKDAYDVLSGKGGRSSGR